MGAGERGAKIDRNGLGGAECQRAEEEERRDEGGEAASGRTHELRRRELAGDGGGDGEAHGDGEADGR